MNKNFNLKYLLIDNGIKKCKMLFFLGILQWN